MGVWELCDGRTPGIPEVISQFEEKRKSALLAKPPVRADAQAPRKMFTVRKNSHLRGSPLGS